MEFVSLDIEEFKKAREKFIGNSFYQTYHWTKVKHITGWDAYMVGVKENNEIVACTLIIGKKLFIKHYFYYAPRGMLLDYNNKELLKFFTMNIKKFLKEKEGLIFKIDPLIEYKKHDKDGNIVNEEFNNQKIINNLKEVGFKHHGFTKGYSGDIQFRWSYVLDLDKTMDDLYIDMSKRCRRCIRKAENYPLEIELVNNDNKFDFKNIMESTAIRHKDYDRSLEYYKSLDKELKEKSILLIAYLDRDKFLENFEDDKLYEKVKSDTRKKIPISAGVFIFDSERMNYVYGGTYKEYMPLMAQYKVQMEMIKYTKEKLKLPIYDFGGISGDFNPKSKNYGVYEFKKGFGGRVVEYIGEFDLIISPFKNTTFEFSYFILRNIRKFKIRIINIISKILLILSPKKEDSKELKYEL